MKINLEMDVEVRKNNYGHYVLFVNGEDASFTNASAEWDFYGFHSWVGQVFGFDINDKQATKTFVNKYLVEVEDD